MALICTECSRLEAMCAAQKKENERVTKLMEGLAEKMALDTYWRNNDPRDEVKEGSRDIIVTDAFFSGALSSVVCWATVDAKEGEIQLRLQNYDRLIERGEPWPEHYAWIYPPKKT